MKAKIYVRVVFQSMLKRKHHPRQKITRFCYCSQVQKLKRRLSKAIKNILHYVIYTTIRSTGKKKSI